MSIIFASFLCQTLYRTLFITSMYPNQTINVFTHFVCNFFICHIHKQWPSYYTYYLYCWCISTMCSHLYYFMCFTQRLCKMCHSFTMLCKRCENTHRTVLMIYFYDICLFVLHVGHLMAEPIATATCILCFSCQNLFSDFQSQACFYIY